MRASLNAGASVVATMSFKHAGGVADDVAGGVAAIDDLAAGIATVVAGVVERTFAPDVGLFAAEAADELEAVNEKRDVAAEVGGG